MTFRVLLLADSRARGLTHRIQAELIAQGIINISFSILFYPGATITQTVQRAFVKLTQRRPYDLIYISTGVNNLTSLLRPHCVVPTFENATTLVSTLMGDYIWAKYALTPHANRIIICELIGMSIATYNTDGEAFPEEQTIINNGILSLNPLIRGLNALQDLTTPHFEQHVHKVRHGRFGHRYSGTLTDGIHYNDSTKDKFARNLVYTIVYNIHATCN